MSMFADAVRRARRRLLVLALVAVSSVALFVFVTSGAALPDDGAIPEASGEAAASFVAKITTPSSGDDGIEVTITEEELSSFLAIGARLAREMEGEVASLETLGAAVPEAFDEFPGGELLRDELAARDATPGLVALDRHPLTLGLSFRDPAVLFRPDGTVVLRGDVRFLVFAIPSRIVVAPDARDGALRFDFVEGSLGRLPLPAALAETAAHGFADAVLAGREYASIDRISVGDGTMRIAASLSG